MTEAFGSERTQTHRTLGVAMGDSNDLSQVFSAQIVNLHIPSEGIHVRRGYIGK